MQINLNDNNPSFCKHIKTSSVKNLDTITKKAFDNFIKTRTSLTQDIDWEYSQLPLSENLIVTAFKEGQSKIVRFFDRIKKEKTGEDTLLIPKSWIGNESMENEMIFLKQDCLKRWTKQGRIQ